MRQTFFLRGKFIETVERGEEGFLYPTGRGFFCPFCNELWLHAPIEGRPTLTQNVICERHGIEKIAAAWMTPQKGFYVVGSVIDAHDSHWNSILPASLWRREFFLTVAEYERRQK